ncbi:MAG: lycopene cyclase family protein [Bacteroidota bacterium]
MRNYDWIIMGGGASGLALCNELISSSLRGDILLIESNEEKWNDRTWCFWSENELGESYQSNFFWKKIEIRTSSGSREFKSDPFSYRLIRSGEFYRKLYDRLSQNARVTIVREKVERYKSLGPYAEVKTDKNIYRGSWVFNSLLSFAPIPNSVRGGLKQHFLGSWIRTEKDCFDPGKIRLMDFEVKQEGGVQFVYLLPISAREALVEYTVFSRGVWEKPRYRTAIKSYLLEKFELQDYVIEEEESGVIPMCPDTFPRITDGRIIHIGSAGGLTKASTGYTFHRIVEDSKALVKSMAYYGRPIPDLKATGRFAFYDRLLLWLVKNKPEKVPGIFLHLFSCNPKSVFKFLAEKSNLLEEIGLFLRLPWPPFLTALWHEYFKPSSTKSLGSISQHDHLDLPIAKLAKGNQSGI